MVATGLRIWGKLSGMVRVTLLIALGAGLVLATPASSADQRLITRYCSTSGDICYGIFDERGAVRFRLTTAVRYFGRYRICVRPAGRGVTCKSFPIRKVGSNYGGTVIWLRNFRSAGSRSYRVTWKIGTTRLGPTLTFRPPAPVT